MSNELRELNDELLQQIQEQERLLEQKTFSPAERQMIEHSLDLVKNVYKMNIELIDLMKKHND